MLAEESSGEEGGWGFRVFAMLVIHVASDYWSLFDHHVVVVVAKKVLLRCGGLARTERGGKRGASEVTECYHHVEVKYRPIHVCHHGWLCGGSCAGAVRWWRGSASFANRMFNRWFQSQRSNWYSSVKAEGESELRGGGLGRLTPAQEWKDPAAAV